MASDPARMGREEVQLDYLLAAVLSIVFSGYFLGWPMGCERVVVGLRGILCFGEYIADGHRKRG